MTVSLRNSLPLSVSKPRKGKAGSCAASPALQQPVPHRARREPCVRDRLRAMRYARTTEETYISWIRRYILFHAKRHPIGMGEREVEQFLTHLARDKQVASSTQNQALSAVLFRYDRVLSLPLHGSIHALRARGPRRLPTVLSQLEVQRLLSGTTGTIGVIVRLLYGSGMRLNEALSLRVRHLDLERRRDRRRRKRAKGPDDHPTEGSRRSAEGAHAEAAVPPH